MAQWGRRTTFEDQVDSAVIQGPVYNGHQRSLIEEAPPIGIGTDKMMVGEMGSSPRADYVFIGRDANLGARICNLAEGGHVLISQATYDLVKEGVQAIPLPGQRFKGTVTAVTVNHVTQVLD